MQSPGKVEIDAQHSINSILFVDDGKQAMSGGADGMLRRWNVADGQEVGNAIDAEGEIHAAMLSPNRQWLACGFTSTKDNGWSKVGIWDAQTHSKVLDFQCYQNKGISSLDISSDSTKIATGEDGAATVWSMSTGKQLVALGHHGGSPGMVGVRFCPTSDRIATATTVAVVPSPKPVQTNHYSHQYQYSTPAPAKQNTTYHWIYVWDTNSGLQLVTIQLDSQNDPRASSSLAWSVDGQKLFAASYNKIKCFNASTGSLLSSWSCSSGDTTSLSLSHSQKFLVVSAYNLQYFLDTSTYKQLGTRVNHTSQIQSVALSSDDEWIATGEQNGKITFRRLGFIIPRLSVALNLPLIYITDASFEAWMRGDWTRVEDLLTNETVYSEDSSYHACVFAIRALSRARSGQWNMALDDAKQSLKIQRSVAGHIADAMAQLGNGGLDSALRAFDLVFSDTIATDNNFLWLIRAIILFESRKHDDAVARVDDLIKILNVRSLHITVRAYMFLLLGGMALKDGDKRLATELLTRAREAIPFQKDSRLVTIALIFGWDFDKLAHVIQLHLQECIIPHEDNGDAALQSNNLKDAISHYSTALSLDPLNPRGLLVKRSEALAKLGLWEDALKDADEAIKVDPQSPWGHERRHAALHALGRFDEAVVTFTYMISLIEESLDEDVRQRGKMYISPSLMEAVIDNVVRGVLKLCPIVLVDVATGRFCDGPERLNLFKSTMQFKELVSSMTEGLDDELIQWVVNKYFEYVMLSHVWEGKEPSFQDVNSATSVWRLKSSLLNDKLRKFCEVVRNENYRWAWTDTCCIDKTNSTVLYQSLTMMYRWYETSAATFILLVDVEPLSAPGGLRNSTWMTRAWTAQEVLAPKVVRFYNRDWKPYLDDTRANHKESPEIMEELADAMGVTRGVITAFDPDDLSVEEKLRLASRRTATIEEDVAYSLMGIFKSDIRPHYGEGDAALGHLLEEIVARLNVVTVLAWNGASSLYNSCLPANIAVYHRTPSVLPAVNDADMEVRVATLRESLSRSDAKLVYDRITELPSARFFNRRLHLPCIIFPVKKLQAQDSGSGRYRARVSCIGQVEFQTSDRLSSTEPHKLIFVHPWLRDLRDPPDTIRWTSTMDSNEYDSDLETDYESAPSSPMTYPSVLPAVPMDEYTRALRLVARLHGPFYALLLEQQRHGEFRRVAAEHEIVLPGIERAINFAGDVCTDVVEIA